MADKSFFEWSKLITELEDIRAKKFKFETPDDLLKLEAPDSISKVLPTLLGSFIPDLEIERQKLQETRRKRLEAQREILLARDKEIREGIKRREKEVTAPQEKKFVVAGRIVDKESGLGLPRVHIRVWDQDISRGKDDELKRLQTDQFGYFRLEYKTKDFNDPDRKAELFLTIEDETGKEIYRSKTQQKPDKVEFFEEKIDGGKLPYNLELAKSFDSNRAALQATFKRRLRSIEAQRKFAFGQIRK